MNLGKPALVGLSALALIAFALPVTASADPEPNGVFLNDHEPIEPSEDIAGNFTGQMQAVVLGTAEGFHCEKFHWGISLSFPWGITLKFEQTDCTTTSSDAAKSNLPVHSIKVGSWTVEPNYETDSIIITNFHINNKVTHPLTSHLVVSESTLRCPVVHAKITPESPTVTIEGAELEGTGCKVQTGLPPSGSEISMPISGHLHQEEPLTIGLGAEQDH